MPYCFFNVLTTLGIWYFKIHENIDGLTFSDQGHTFSAVMVSVLLVTRFKITYNRFRESSVNLCELTCSCRELIQHMIILSRYEQSKEAYKWKFEESYCALMT